MEIDLNGTILHPGSKKPLGETVLMTSVGNNDRGTFIIPESDSCVFRKSLFGKGWIALFAAAVIVIRIIKKT